MSDNSAERVSTLTNGINQEDLRPGDHIYCYGFLALKGYHGIYIGNDYVIWFSEYASDKKCSSAYVKKVHLSDFLGRAQLRLMPYNVSITSSLVKSIQSHTAESQPAKEVIKMAEFYLQKSISWKNYHTLFQDSESFAFYCKTMADDSAKRVGFFSHYITEDLLRPGDHLYCYRAIGIYSHHGIYIGKKDCEVIHFSGDVTKSKSSAYIHKATLKEFTGDHDMRLIAYDESILAKVLNWKSTGHILKSRPYFEVIATAEYYLQHPEEWAKYNLLFNNCESFACYCKTKWKHLNAQGGGWGWLASPPHAPGQKALLTDPDTEAAMKELRKSVCTQ